MKKIAYIVESLDSGVGKHVTDLYRNLSTNEDYKIYVLYGSQRADDNLLKLIREEEKIEIINLSRKIGFNDIKCYFELKKYLKKIKPDIVHCHSSKAGLTGRIAAKFAGVKRVFYSPHAYFFLKYDENSMKRWVFVKAERMLSRLFTYKTITTSKGEDEAFEKCKIDKPSKRILIEHGLELPVFSNEDRKQERIKYGVNDNNIFIGAMARFEEQKDPIGTIKIMNELCKRNTNVKCIFWGDGSLFDEAKDINKVEGGNVILPGATHNPDINLYSLDVFLTASLYEGLPYTLLESLGMELPIIASNVEGNKDCVFDGKNGYLFESKDYEGAVNKIEKIIKEDLSNYRNESKKIFNDRFSMKKMMEKYMKLYSGDNDE